MGIQQKVTLTCDNFDCETSEEATLDADLKNGKNGLKFSFRTMPDGWYDVVEHGYSGYGRPEPKIFCQKCYDRRHPGMKSR